MSHSAANELLDLSHVLPLLLLIDVVQNCNCEKKSATETDNLKLELVLDLIARKMLLRKMIKVLVTDIDFQATDSGFWFPDF